LSPNIAIAVFIPVAGRFDDAAVLLLVGEMISKKVCRYAGWKAKRDKRAKELYASACG
jgi:uncharacterized membrane protein YkvA (DUF1232 family)